MPCLARGLDGLRRTRAPRQPAAGVAAHRAACLAVTTLLACAAAQAQPTSTISPPQPRDQVTPVERRAGGTAAPPQSSATDKVGAERLEQERQARMQRVFVEGYRDPDDRVRRDSPVEQRFATTLDSGSPDFVAGRRYDGCLYDGTFFSCPDPIASTLRNLKHLLR